MTLHEISEAAKIIQEAADPDANIIFGAVIDRAVKGSVKVTVIATGFEGDAARSRVVESRGFDMARNAPAQPTIAATATTRAPAPEPQVDDPGRGRFFRRGGEGALDFDATDDGFTPNFVKRKDDLDVPAFLRKQMD